MKVRITKDCIRDGKRSDKERCPIGLALLKRGYADVTVDREAVAFRISPNNVRVLPLSKEAQAFIEAFDDDAEVQPFTMELHL